MIPVKDIDGTIIGKADISRDKNGDLVARTVLNDTVAARAISDKILDKAVSINFDVTPLPSIAESDLEQIRDWADIEVGCLAYFGNWNLTCYDKSDKTCWFRRNGREDVMVVVETENAWQSGALRVFKKPESFPNNVRLTGMLIDRKEGLMMGSLSGSDYCEELYPLAGFVCDVIVVPKEKRKWS